MSSRHSGEVRHQWLPGVCKWRRGWCAGWRTLTARCQSQRGRWGWCFVAGQRRMTFADLGAADDGETAPWRPARPRTPGVGDCARSLGGALRAFCVQGAGPVTRG